MKLEDNKKLMVQVDSMLNKPEEEISVKERIELIKLKIDLLDELSKAEMASKTGRYP